MANKIFRNYCKKFGHGKSKPFDWSKQHMVKIINDKINKIDPLSPMVCCAVGHCARCGDMISYLIDKKFLMMPSKQPLTFKTDIKPENTFRDLVGETELTFIGRVHAQ